LCTSLKYEMVNSWNKLLHSLPCSESWSCLASSGRGVQRRVSEFNVINKWNFISSSRAIWKLNPCGLRVFISVYLSEHHVSSLSFTSCWDSYGNWVSTITRWIKFSLFLLGYLMLFIWDNNTTIRVNNCIINGGCIDSCRSWCSINSFPAFAGSNNSVRKINIQSNIWKSKMLGALAIR